MGRQGSKLIQRNLYQSPQSYPAPYVTDVMEGLPIGVQIVGLIHKDEKVLEMMRIVDEALGRLFRSRLQHAVLFATGALTRVVG